MKGDMLKMIRPEIELVEVVDVITTSTAPTNSSSKPGIETPEDEF